MIIDMHVHVFPEALAKRALGDVGETSHMPPVTDATVQDTRQKLNGWGISAGVLLHIATKPGQQRKINQWAAEIQDDFFYSFGSVHPDDPDSIPELTRIRELGLHGVKLHPDYQNFFANDKKVYPIYEAIQDLGLPVTFHAGWDPVSPEVCHTPPHDVAEIARRFPRMTIIAAHLGGMDACDEVERHLVGLENVYLDTSMSYLFCKPEQTRRIIQNHGHERILFASDCPWSLPTKQIALIDSLGLSTQALEHIYFRNAQRLLSIADIRPTTTKR